MARGAWCESTLELSELGDVVQLLDDAETTLVDILDSMSWVRTCSIGKVIALQTSAHVGSWLQADIQRLALLGPLSARKRTLAN